MVAESQVVADRGVLGVLLDGALIEPGGRFEVALAILEPGVADQRVNVVGIHVERFAIVGLGFAEIAGRLVHLSRGHEHGGAWLARGRLQRDVLGLGLGLEDGDHLRGAALDAGRHLVERRLLVRCGLFAVEVQPAATGKARARATEQKSLWGTACILAVRTTETLELIGLIATLSIVRKRRLSAQQTQLRPAPNRAPLKSC